MRPLLMSRSLAADLRSEHGAAAVDQLNGNVAFQRRGALGKFLRSLHRELIQVRDVVAGFQFEKFSRALRSDVREQNGP